MLTTEDLAPVVVPAFGESELPALCLEEINRADPVRLLAVTAYLTEITESILRNKVALRDRSTVGLDFLGYTHNNSHEALLDNNYISVATITREHPDGFPFSAVYEHIRGFIASNKGVQLEKRDLKAAFSLLELAGEVLDAENVRQIEESYSTLSDFVQLYNRTVSAHLPNLSFCYRDKQAVLSKRHTTFFEALSDDQQNVYTTFIYASRCYPDNVRGKHISALLDKSETFVYDRIAELDLQGAIYRRTGTRLYNTHTLLGEPVPYLSNLSYTEACVFNELCRRQENGIVQAQHRVLDRAAFRDASRNSAITRPLGNLQDRGLVDVDSSGREHTYHILHPLSEDDILSHVEDSQLEKTRRTLSRPIPTGYADFDTLAKCEAAGQAFRVAQKKSPEANGDPTPVDEPDEVMEILSQQELFDGHQPVVVNDTYQTVLIRVISSEFGSVDIDTLPKAVERAREICQTAQTQGWDPAVLAEVLETLGRSGSETPEGA